MLPPAHIAYTVAALSEIQKRTGRFQDADYRLIVLAAVAPDLVDKPLAWLYFYRKYRAAVLFAHTLIAHLAVLLLTLWRAPHRLVYALAFNGHAIADRLWFFHDTWYWPFRGWRFHVWRKAGSEQPDIKRAYWHTFTRRPELWRWEVGGMAALLWFAWSNWLWEWPRLRHLLVTGRLDHRRERD
jgi:inner membrane protein